MRNIFLINGLLISIIGTVVGLSLAFIIISLQQQYGIVPMGMETSIVASFPVEMRLNDFVLTAIAMLSVSAIISIYPANKASRVIISENI